MTRKPTPERPPTSVFSTIAVDAPLGRAFDLFTQGIGSWWDADHHVLPVPVAEMIFEPYVGGYVYDRGIDGSECRWARVLLYEPPERFVISWDVSPAWRIESDPARTSEVEVRFVAEGARRTRVELEHRHLDRHGEGWQQMRDAVASPEGWPAGLQAFAERSRTTTRDVDEATP